MDIRSPSSAAPQRYIDRVALIQTILLFGAAAVLLTKVFRGVLVFYLHPRYTPLIIGCGVVLIIIAALRARTIFSDTPMPHDERSWRYLLLAVPLLFGTFVPARPLGANALANTTDVSTALSGSAPTDDNTEQWNLLQWTTGLSVRSDLNGKTVNVVGFVYHDPARAFEGFLVSRFVIICCTADGNGVKLPVIGKGGSTMAASTWVQVRGTIGTTIINGKAEPAVIATAIEPVPQPTFPYLYP